MNAEIPKDQEQESNIQEQKSLEEKLLKEREILLKEKELSLKELETKIQLEIERRKIWSSSPVLIALASAIFGIAGTAIGAALQGYSSFQLERQKFEFSLIQKALETEENFIVVSDEDRREAARRLLFLVNSGVLKSLNSDAIRRLANEPDELPTFTSRGAVSFSCQMLDGTPTTIASHPNRGLIPLIKWTNTSFSNSVLSPMELCIQASSNLQKAQTERKLNYIIPFKQSNGDTAICASSTPGGTCDIEI